MVQIAIVEDERSSIAQLQGYLQRYQHERGSAADDIKVSVFTDGDQLMDYYRPKYDMIFMDVQMERLDGLTTAKLIRRQDPEVIIIFISNLAQYATYGYTVDALDYLLKPISYFAFSQRLDRAFDRLRKRKKHYLTITAKGEMRKLDVSEIRYVESQNHTLIIHTRQEKIAIRGTMREAEEKLGGHGFVRCNKGYLLNLEHVDAVRSGCAIVGEDSLLISRGRENAFLKQLTNYLAGRTK